jgi:hypothetical protein
MSATLTKIENGKPAVFDDLKNKLTVKCPRCDRTYQFGYSDKRMEQSQGLVETR